jgi:hypothetical protein
MHARTKPQAGSRAGSRAGVVPIAHNSGGPAADIVTLEAVPGGLQATGYLCTSEDEFAAAITDVLAMDQVSRLRLAAAARRCAPRPCAPAGCVQPVRGLSA